MSAQEHQDERLRRAAYHEAGHAVAHFLLGVPFPYVTVVPDEDGNALGHLAPPETPGWVDEALWDADYGSTHGRFIAARTRRWVEQQIITFLAGAEVDASRGSPPEEVDAGIGIHHLTPERARLLSEKFGVPVEKVLLGNEGDS